MALAVNKKRLFFTFDLEDHSPESTHLKRYPEITDSILEFLEVREMEATVFVLGRLALDDPSLIRKISQAGHEIAFHSLAHVHLTRETPGRFQRETADSKRHLEDITGRPVVGYRAPAFSLTKESRWAVDIIGELGFAYSSSLLPAKNPIYGFPNAPAQPFRWPNGLLEIPAPVARVGPVVIPFLGGIYLRYLPLSLIRRLLATGDLNQCYWTYCHPHDFDYQEPFYRIEGTSLATNLLLWFNRKNTFKKLDGIFPYSNTPSGACSFAKWIERGAFAEAPNFYPDSV